MNYCLNAGGGRDARSQWNIVRLSDWDVILRVNTLIGGSSGSQRFDTVNDPAHAKCDECKDCFDDCCEYR